MSAREVVRSNRLRFTDFVKCETAVAVEIPTNSKFGICFSFRTAHFQIGSKLTVQDRWRLRAEKRMARPGCPSIIT